MSLEYIIGGIVLIVLFYIGISWVEKLLSIDELMMTFQLHLKTILKEIEKLKDSQGI